jgi:hypothetical protein
VLVTASGGARGKKAIPLKGIVDKAVDLAAKDGFKVRDCLISIDCSLTCS